MISNSKSDGAHMILCDSGSHMGCMKPAMEAVPDGSWFCPGCPGLPARGSQARAKGFTLMPVPVLRNSSLPLGRADLVHGIPLQGSCTNFRMTLIES